MKNKKLVMAAILVILCLSITVFMVLPTRSQTGSGQYDPWIDLNDDGIIDIYDAITFADHFNTVGTPINKTALLLDLLARIDSLNATVVQQQNAINNLNNTVMELQNTTNYLNTTVNYLNQTVIVLNSTKGLGTPDYDSGWRSIPEAGYISLTHNLNTTDAIVYLYGKYNWGGYEWVHQCSFGGDDRHIPSGFGQGAYWTSVRADDGSTTIYVSRGMSDNQAECPWEYARVMIWKIPQPQLFSSLSFQSFLSKDF